MRHLEYRLPRVHAQFGVDFAHENNLFRGICVNVSKKGLRASFSHAIPVGWVGFLNIYHPLCKTMIPARVVYLLENQVGFGFSEQSSSDDDIRDHFLTILGIEEVVPI